MEFYQISITHSKPIIVCYIIMHGKRRTEEQEGREWSGRDAGSQCFTQFSILSQSCSPLEKGRTKGAGWIDGICTNPLLRRSHLCEADPSPGLWPSAVWPKRKAFDGQAKRLLYSGQTWTSYAGCPSLRGNLLTGILNSWGDPPECRPLEKGRAKGAG